MSNEGARRCITLGLALALLGACGHADRPARSLTITCGGVGPDTTALVRAALDTLARAAQGPQRLVRVQEGSGEFGRAIRGYAVWTEHANPAVRDGGGVAEFDCVGRLQAVWLGGA